MINVSDAATVDFILQGSNDGRIWEDIATFQQNQFGTNRVTATGVRTPYIRMAVSIAGTDQEVRFDGDLSPALV